jgi:hypothetical protein
MPFHKQGAYDGFDSLQEANHHYRRCRKRKHFILSDIGAAKDNPVCMRCGSKILEIPNGKTEKSCPPGYRGNRCTYYPKHKKSGAMHYLCSMENLIGAVLSVERLI